jgi:hypothetical protein
MLRASRYLGSLVLAAAIAAPLFTTACGESHPYRAYDSYDHDYHQWGPEEQGYYSQWAVQVHIGNRPYRKLDRDHQAQYWQWRHSHGDHHDRDHDNDHHGGHDRH